MDFWKEMINLQKKQIENDQKIIDELRAIRNIIRESNCEDMVKCNNCGNVYSHDEFYGDTNNELAYEDQICQYCMQDGYGQ